MSESIDDERLDVLLLARLCSYGKAQTPTRARIAKDLLTFVEGRLVESQWHRLVEDRLQQLREAGFVEPSGTGPTAKAFARVKEVFGFTRIPDWKSLKSKHLIGWMIGLDPKTYAKLDLGRVQAQIICDAHGLRPKKGPPTLGQALDLWMWRQLGIDSDDKFSVGKARARLLERALSLGQVSTRTTEQGAMMAAAAIGAVSSKPDALRRRIVQRAVFPERQRGRSRPVVAPTSTSRDTVNGVEHIATAAQRAADATSDGGRYNERKVFISAVWRRLTSDPEFGGLSLDDFKRTLVSANQRGLLRLHRADLVGSMETSEVVSSEIKHQNATFHFIESEPRRLV